MILIIWLTFNISLAREQVAHAPVAWQCLLNHEEQIKGLGIGAARSVQGILFSFPGGLSSAFFTKASRSTLQSLPASPLSAQGGFAELACISQLLQH